MLRPTTRILMLVSLVSLVSGAALANSEHTIWRAPDAEMGPVSWTGFTLTPEVSDNTLHLGGPGSALLKNPDGFRAGLALGYDYQTSGAVIGALGEAFYTWMDGRAPGSGPAAYTSELPYMGSLRARLGVVHGRFMAYGTGGLALARMTIEDQARGARSSKTMAGWSAGAGIEYAWNKRITARIEYLHMGYGSYTFGALPTGQNRVSSAMDPLSLHVAFRF